MAVRGTHADIAAVASRRPTPSCWSSLSAGRAPTSCGTLVRAATEAGLGVKVLPPLTELLRPWVGHSDLRDLDITDLLGRRPVDIDIGGDRRLPRTGKRVLVTGAGGSIGSELCRQIHRFGPAELLMLDRDESALHATQLSIYGTALLDSPDVVLADIRDAETRRRDLQGAPARGGLPRRRAEAPAAARAVPGRGVEDQRPRHPDRAGGGPARAGRPLRQHLHRQGGQPDQRARPVQADRRAARRARRSRGRRRARSSRSGSATCSAAAARCSPRSPSSSRPGSRSP